MKTEIEMKFDTEEVQKIYSELKKENVLLKQDLKKSQIYHRTVNEHEEFI